MCSRSTSTCGADAVCTYVQVRCPPGKEEGQAEAAATDGNKRNVREDAFEDKEVNDDDELIGGWSQYETMNDADRGMLLEKAILALGLNQEEED